MNNAENLKQERDRLFHDVCNNTIPKRVPINVNMTLDATAEFGGLDPNDVLWDPPKAIPAIHALCEKLPTDICPTHAFAGRLPGHYTMSGSQSFVQGAKGFVQHPEVVGMYEEDYDFLIERPLDCLVERVLPRQFKGLDLKEPMKTAFTFAKTIALKNADVFACLGFLGKINAQYGYHADNGMARAMTTAPFDFIADQLRSFSGISKDIRRMPEKVEEACRAVLPLMVKAGTPKMLVPGCCAYSFLHMPSFMRPKDFEKYWWPTFLDMCNTLASMGIKTDTFCEDNWERYLDFVSELPANSVVKFEKDNPAVVKEKLGRRHVLTGMYPLTLLKTGTKEQCVDKAKELIDTLAPGGGYIFSLDKVILTAGSIDLSNLIAVLEYVRDNALYENAGEASGTVFDKNDYKSAEIKPIDSKYYNTGEFYRAQNPMVTEFAESKLHAQDDAVLNFVLNMLF